MKEYILVTKGDPKIWNALSPDETQRIMEKYYAFVNRLKRENRFKGGSAVKDGGIELRAEKGIILTDGPFPETKEAMTGYLLLEAESHEEAVLIARDCPALTHGESVQIFQLTDH